MKIDLEQLKIMKEIFTHDHMGEVVPVHASQDKDSFATFTEGLKSNWIFVMAAFGFGLWLVSGVNKIDNTNAFQDIRIETNIEDIAQNRADIQQNAKNIQTLSQTQVSNYNDVVNRLNLLQISVDSLKKEVQPLE